ncbi:site-2 protease family protein [Candidatus Microgenomates bacterium]|nr:site-2 protease family protein [Candidatus Microgenomates bacterium]
MTLTFIVFIFVISILVLVHELGHFLMAKKFGIKVEEFGLGLPPRIWGIKKGETTYSINILPIGGFVKLFGEEGEEENSKTPKLQKAKLERAFFAKPLWQRAMVLLAGVVMNFILAVLVFSFLFTQGVFVPTDRVTVEKVEENSPAEGVGLEEGDIIKEIKVDLLQDYPGRSSTQDSPGIEIKSAEKLINFTKEHLGEEIELLVLRGEEELTFKITPRKDPPEGQGAMGIAISDFEEKTYPWYKAPFWGTYEAFKLSGVLVKGLGQTLWRLITFQPIKEEVAGPVGIAQITGKAVKFGKMAVLELLGLLSLNLAVINILPFPALDGGRLLFLGTEATTGKKIKAKWERIAHQTGMTILLVLLLLVTINDVLRIVKK